MSKDRIRMVRGYISSPPNPEADAAKARFEAINAFVAERGGWLVSVPGDPAMRLQVLPGSSLPDQLRKLGYIVVPVGTTSRILPHAVAQRFETSSSGALLPVTEGSSRPVTVCVTNAGIATVEQYDLRMP
jgi:hypothetical protein